MALKNVKEVTGPRSQKRRGGEVWRRSLTIAQYGSSTIEIRLDPRLNLLRRPIGESRTLLWGEFIGRRPQDCFQGRLQIGRVMSRAYSGFVAALPVCLCSAS